MAIVDQLTEIGRDGLLTLRKLYAPDGKKSYRGFVTIDILIGWFEKDPNLNIKVFSLNDDLSNGTFFATDRQTRTAYADTLSEITDELLRLLHLIDYSKGHFFVSISDHAAPAVREAIKRRNVEMYYDDWNLLYYLPKEKALEFNIQLPDDVELKPLTKFCDIQKAYSLWPVGDKSSVKLLERLAKYNPSVGAFLKDETIVAWIFQLWTGLLLDLQTDPDHHGHGYASLVTRALSKKIAESGYDLYCGIYEDNTPSRMLFGKLGFEHVGKVHWICTKIDWTEEE